MKTLAVCIAGALQVTCAVYVLVPPIVDQVTILRNDSKNVAESRWRYLGYRCIRNMYAEEQHQCGKFHFRSSVNSTARLANLTLLGLRHQLGDGRQPYVDVHCFDDETDEIVEVYRFAVSDQDWTVKAVSSAKITVKLADQLQVQLTALEPLVVTVSWSGEPSPIGQEQRVRCLESANGCISATKPNGSACSFALNNCAGPVTFTTGAIAVGSGRHQNVVWTVHAEKYRAELAAGSDARSSKPFTLRYSTRPGLPTNTVPQVPHNVTLRFDGFIVNDQWLVNVSSPEARASYQETLRICCRYSNHADSKIALVVTWTIRQSTIEHSSVNSLIQPRDTVSVCINHTVMIMDTVHLVQCTGKYQNNGKSVTAALKVLQEATRDTVGPIVTSDNWSLFMDTNVWIVLGLIVLLLLFAALGAVVLFRKCRNDKKKTSKNNERNEDSQTLPRDANCSYARLTSCTCSQPLSTIPCHSPCHASRPVINGDSLARTSTYRTAGSVVDEHIHQARQSSKSPSNESGVVDERSYDSGIANGGTYQTLTPQHTDLLGTRIMDLMANSGFSDMNVSGKNYISYQSQTENLPIVESRHPVPYTREEPTCNLHLTCSPRMNRSNWPPAEIELVPENGTVFLTTFVATSV